MMTNQVVGETTVQEASGEDLDSGDFLRMMSAGGAAAAFAACAGLGRRDTKAAPSIGGWFKDTTSLVEHPDGRSLESRLSDVEGLLTPTSLFFVRNNSVSLDLDATEWRLLIEGDAVSNPLSLTYEEIRRMPSRALISYLECAGNQRAMFDIVNGRRSPGAQWLTGGVGNAEWVGAPLSDVLELAGLRENAAVALLIGLDEQSPEGGFRRVLPIEKALHPDTLLAYDLNGKALPRDHGFPLRAIVPGWVGSSSIKWLGRIIVSSRRLWTRNNTVSYVMIGDEYPPEGEARGEVITEQVIKSALALPWPARLPSGRLRLHGYAHSPGGMIDRVEWSLDGGASWRSVDELEQPSPRSWARFAFTWDAPPGERSITTRATDAAGGTQPARIPFNEKGYLFNQPVPHPVRVE